VRGTPTIFVVGNGGAATPAIEVTDDRSKLYPAIEDMLSKVPAAAPAKKAAPKKAPAKSPAPK
jgi:hypothetical protein